MNKKGHKKDVGINEITLRDYAAFSTIQGMYACEDFMNENLVKRVGSKEEAREKIAEWAYAQADALLEKR